MRSSSSRPPSPSCPAVRPNRIPASSIPRRRPSRARRRRRVRHPAIPRITGLIVGVDSGVGRNTSLTDTMIVVSLDPVTETVSMVSIPRDMVDAPLADGRKYRGKINGLAAYARHHPKQFPGSDGTGYDVLMDALGTLLKLDISVLRDRQPRWLRVGRQSPRRRGRQRRALVLRHALQRVRLRERVLDHRGPPPPQRQPGPRVRAHPQGERRERLHPRRASAGGAQRHPRRDRGGRLPQRPDRPAQGRSARPSRPTSRARRSRTSPRRPAGSSAPTRIARSSPTRW